MTPQGSNGDPPSTERTHRSNGVDGASEDGESRSPPETLAIERPSVDLAASLADWWVALADEQRAYRSHLLGAPNRPLIEEALARHIVTEGLLVARLPGAYGEPSTGPVETDRSTKGEGGPSFVGFVMFGPETGSYEQSVDRGIIENLYVHPDYRSRGIGSALLDGAEAALAENGVEAIALEAMADNHSARRFYARRGYRPHRIEFEAAIDDLSADDER